MAIPNSPDVARYMTIIKDKLADLRPDGSIWLNQDYFDYATGLKMVNESKWAELIWLSQTPARR